MALFLNGNKTESIFSHIKNAEAVLENVVGKEMIDQKKAWIERCDKKDRNGIMLNRNDFNIHDLLDVQRQISYLAKLEQKKGVKGKTFFSSRIKNR